MAPIPPAEGRTLWVVGARGPEPGHPTSGEIVAQLRTLSKESEALVAVFDARSVAGERHLLSAWAHLGRARARGETRLRERGAEFALFVAGDDQLPRALKKVGVGPDTQQFVVVGERPREPPATLTALGLTEDPAAYPKPIDEAMLDRLGIEAADRQAVPVAAWEGLVLERVALLEMSGAHASPSPKKA